jgi:glyoxylase-like metal-dependent hydrolase (beta-lactamase superfamily II)
LQEIVVSHAIPNHFAGVHGVLDLHMKMGLEPPKIYKKLDGNNYEQLVFASHPYLKDRVTSLTRKIEFTVKERLKGGLESETILGVIETPGHRSDHCSFSLKNTALKQNFLFPCDMILGSDSVSLRLFIT